jgi:methyl-accepting chemotaxis protein
MTEHGDTSRKIPTDLTDAYSMTAARINQAFDLFRMVLSQLEDASGRLSGTVMSFSSQIRETVAATTQQASAVKEVVGTMENSNQINRQIEEQARSLSGNAQESQVYVDDGFGKVQDTIRKMDEIKTSNMQTLNEIGELTMQISSIGEIIDIINNIANQTRIIAFNAELEASSAGAAGVSFRIVAEEIRRLANSTVDSLVGIKGRITEIQQSSGRLLASSEEGTGKINEGMKLSGDLNDIFMRIRMSAESTSGSADGISRILVEQNEAFDQIFMTLKQIAEGAEQVLASTRISGSEIGKLQTLIDGLKNVLDRFEYEKEIPAT